ncbi:MAG: MCP four helix bundle domain-containing protein, partial [Desulfobulbaceae bacterium]|nr:MCP four helix bundle domain-containing protein [Desulfobulbaceae bacterium]
MRVISGLTLKWRLLAGFLFCAVLTGLSGGAGILSLQQIQESMKGTTQEIGVTIDNQNEQARQLMPLRNLVESIIDTKNEKELIEADKKFKDIRKPGTTGSGEEHITISDTVCKLITHKRNQLSALSDLTTLRNSTIAALDEVTKLAMNTVDNAEFDSAIKLDDAVGEIKGNFEKMSGTTGTAISTIKAALSVRAYCSELNVLVKDALFATDAASVDYVNTEITTLIGNAKNELASLPP